ncbi:MAG: bifunctional riboflavin kinase/FAD synthetase [Acidobacteriaceae bacterium]|nr:bifunctional riboflavin kinase/FAD synthetase [Acidobacteriaceae bacterium]
MRTFHSLAEIPSEWTATVLSVGNFDGVHRAHQLVLGKVVERARELGGKALAVTFEPHPMRVLRPDIAPRLITPLAQKLELLGTLGLDGTVVLPFTRDLSLMPPSAFAEQVLARGLHAREVHEGANFRYGHKAKGDVRLLAEFGKELGFEVVAYPELRLRGENVSSSRIRELLSQGNVRRARHLLGRAFNIVSTPGRGRGYGHRYTVPTINLVQYEELVPADGVYITRTRVNGECFDSVTNVGVRPTFGHESFAIETHLLNFHPIELTAQSDVELHFLERLRGEIKFPSVDALREQISRDVHEARRFFRLFPLADPGNSSL